MEHTKFYSFILTIILGVSVRYISGKLLNDLACALKQSPCTTHNGTETHTVACALTGPVGLSCLQGYYINITQAYWGRINDRSCSNRRPNQIQNCGDHVSKLKLPCKEREQTCSIPLVNGDGSFAYEENCLEQRHGKGVRDQYKETIYMYIIHTCEKASHLPTLLPTNSSHESTTLHHSVNTTRTAGEDSSSSPHTSGGGAGVGVGVGIACVVLIGLGAVFLYILWRRRTKYIKENEPVYLASEKNKKTFLFANLLNPLYGLKKQPDQEHQYYNTREGVDHKQHDYLEVIADTADYDNNNATPDGHVEPQYETVDLDEYSSQTPGKPTIHGALTPEYEEVDLDTPRDSATQPESVIPPSGSGTYL